MKQEHTNHEDCWGEYRLKSPSKWKIKCTSKSKSKEICGSPDILISWKVQGVSLVSNLLEYQTLSGMIIPWNGKQEMAPSKVNSNRHSRSSRATLVSSLVKIISKIICLCWISIIRSHSFFFSHDKINHTFGNDIATKIHPLKTIQNISSSALFFLNHSNNCKYFDSIYENIWR